MNNLCRACYFHIRGLRHVRAAMSRKTAITIACAVVSARLDYCNALLAGMSDANLGKLQRIQNALTRVVTGLHRRDHITPALIELHWLPVRARITFKVATLVYKLMKTRQPSYLSELISDYVPARQLRSSSKILLVESFFRLKMGRRSFRYVGPVTWNNIPEDIRTIGTLSSFRKHLSHFFSNGSTVANCNPSPRPRITLLRYIWRVISLACIVLYCIAISYARPFVTVYTTNIVCLLSNDTYVQPTAVCHRVHHQYRTFGHTLTCTPQISYVCYPTTRTYNQTAVRHRVHHQYRTLGHTLTCTYTTNIVCSLSDEARVQTRRLYVTGYITNIVKDTTQPPTSLDCQGSVMTPGYVRLSPNTESIKHVTHGIETNNKTTHPYRIDDFPPPICMQDLSDDERRIRLILGFQSV